MISHIIQVGVILFLILVFSCQIISDTKNFHKK